jgi:hypothetical protein
MHWQLGGQLAVAASDENNQVSIFYTDGFSLQRIVPQQGQFKMYGLPIEHTI